MTEAPDLLGMDLEGFSPDERLLASLGIAMGILARRLNEMDLFDALEVSVRRWATEREPKP